jgi:alpha-beta hydrolase superfamily lysophospholipase
VIATVSKFLKDHGLTDKPLYLWGASSGGTLALKLPAALMVRQREAKEGEYVPKVSGIISGGSNGGGACMGASFKVC